MKLKKTFLTSILIATSSLSFANTNILPNGTYINTNPVKPMTVEIIGSPSIKTIPDCSSEGGALSWSNPDSSTLTGTIGGMDINNTLTSPTTICGCVAGTPVCTVF